MEALIDFDGKRYVAHLIGEGEWINVSFMCTHRTAKGFDFARSGFISINDKKYRLKHLESLKTVSNDILQPTHDIVNFKIKIDAKLEDL